MMEKILTIILAQLCVCVFCQVDEHSRLVDYYERLIIDRQQKALEYQLPISAESYSNNGDIGKKKDTSTYDYIVIGSGSAGSVIANRLSEVAHLDTLLLEAGTFEDDFVDIPSMAFFAQGTQFNWNHRSIPQNYACLGLKEKRCVFPRGRGIGGTSIINGLVYSRGNRADYDKWRDEGNKGWGYEDVLRYFMKSENSNIEGDEGYHAIGGYWNVEYSKFNSPHLEAYLAANVELGRKILDYNGENQLGVSKAQQNTLNGRRFSLGTAFIKSVKNRKNLHISTESYVVKILINTLTKVAYGVEYMKNGELFVALAKREIILSAGTIGSPQLLMLSGVGPKEHLQELGIPLIQDLKVGNNFKDHACFFGLNILSNTSIPLLSTRGYVEEYLKGNGSYTLPGNNAGVGFFKTNTSEIASPDIEIMLISANRTDAYFQKGYSFSDESTKALTENINISTTFTMYVDVLHPESVGTVRLASKNPFDYPIIDANFLQDTRDLETMYYGINLVLQMLETNAMKQINASLGRVDLPACRNHEYLSKPYWICYLRQLTDSLYHPSGTCKMGVDPYKGAVVDYRLKVYGIKNLRVADASIMPHPISGHTSAPSTMIGEKVSDMVKEDLQKNILQQLFEK